MPQDWSETPSRLITPAPSLVPSGGFRELYLYNFYLIRVEIKVKNINRQAAKSQTPMSRRQMMVKTYVQRQMLQVSICTTSMFPPLHEQQSYDYQYNQQFHKAIIIFSSTSSSCCGSVYTKSEVYIIQLHSLVLLYTPAILLSKMFSHALLCASLFTFLYPSMSPCVFIFLIAFFFCLTVTSCVK